VQEEEIVSVRQDSEVVEEQNISDSSSPLLSPGSEGIHSIPYDDLDVPIAHRKPPRSTAQKLPSKLAPYNVSNHVSYASIGSSYMSFIIALDSTEPIPHNW